MSTITGSGASAATGTSCKASGPKERLSATGTCGHDGHQGVCEDKIRERAYLKWEAAGYPSGDGVSFWLEAETELQAETDE